MYAHPAAMAQQKPETFMLSTEAQQSLPNDAQVALQQVDNLKYFLISAPVDWQAEQYIRRFLLPTGEYISCVLWNTIFHISGTDIVRCLSFRFQAFGRPVKNTKKFEEGIFSDLRNLKAGTDAILEEPKSPFLDFLYKNNCIRTQKKQKVFFWFSVPHDRLFLDALERDLKREKMGQEATTMAVSEPALSFQYDSSQSLYEQLTKAQQVNSSSFSAHQMAAAFPHGQSPSPLLRGPDTMPPPQMLPHTMAPSLPETMVDTMAPFQHMAMGPAATPQILNHEPDFGRPHPGHNNNQNNHNQNNNHNNNNNNMATSQPHQRHSSMPAYGLEYSPAPSFVSSQFEDFSNRGISFEPLTPPQHALNMGAEPAYIANEETGLYSVIPDHLAGNGGLTGIIQLPPSNLAGPGFSRGGYGPGNAYSVIEGSPTYKQRRRRSSVPPSMSAIAATTAAAAAAAAGHRPSDVHRSMSTSVGPVAEGDESGDISPPGLTYSTTSVSMAGQHRDILEMSRHGTPLSTIEGSPSTNPLRIRQPLEFNPIGQELASGVMLDRRPAPRGPPGGVIRRARSATVMELGPYPQKSHSCPIPTCGRLFKRLEHLKRHVRTHTQEKPYICPQCGRAFSRSDNLAQHKRTHEKDENGNYHPTADDEGDYSGDDQIASFDDASPTSESAYATTTSSLNEMANVTSPTSGSVVGMGGGHSGYHHSLQTLSMPMTMSNMSNMNTMNTMSNPQSMNTSGTMT